MDIAEAKKFAKNKIAADDMLLQVRNVIQETKWAKQNMREGFTETFSPLIESQESIKKSIDDQQNATIKQLQKNQLALTEGLNKNRMAITEGLDKFDEIKRWDLAQLPGFEAIEDEGEEYKEDPSPKKDPKIAYFNKEFLDRNINNKESQDILAKYGYYSLPSAFLDQDITKINKQLEVVKEDLIEARKALKNTVIIVPSEKGFNEAKLLAGKNAKPNTQELKKIHDAISAYATNLNYLREYKEKFGSGLFQQGQGMVYFNNPHQLLHRLELLGGSILAGNNGVINEFSQIAHLLNQMKVISNKQLNDLIKTFL